MYDRLQDAPLYKEMMRLAGEKVLKEAEEARKVARQVGELMALRKVLLLVVQTRFPKLLCLAECLASTINQASVLETLIIKISTASTSKKARRLLLASIEKNIGDD